MPDSQQKKSIVVLVSGNGSNLQAIIDACAQQKLPANVSAVISNKADAYGLQRAKNANIPAVFLDHSTFTSREDYDRQLLAEISTFSPDLIVLAGFMRILSPDFVAHFEGKMLNIHPSLLPKYKGLHTHQRAIDAGDTEHGVSVHFVTAALDDGPVILQSKVPVFAEQDPEELAQRVQVQERQMYPLVIKWFCQGRLLMKNNKAFLDGNELEVQGYAAD
ncbi:phosphoribosylglycinamide formyltransferase [Paraglaciecola hydrolytica]|uniref:Phosphoribosylglycinamide formyltransferase n=1 Tax=Paraglaciecola hydrolytica TaxID=1799789 RepID=A0A136A111_9ALTE|nr:phosphoribosylglycinamide formyltransferase [Paraglaciecola hydrolytica]KXI28914.1 phosphoribosylglycinamide formyltransferase [Paraglaciecola hydrolytica]